MAADVIDIPLEELRRLRVVRVSRPSGEALVVLIDDQIKVYDGVCPHLGGPLLEGEIRGDRITCPWHRYEWSLVTGKCFTVPGKIWDGVEGYTRPTAPYSCPLVPVRFEVTEGSVRLTLQHPGDRRDSRVMVSKDTPR